MGMIMLKSERDNNRWISIFSIIIIYLLAVSRTIISLGLNQADVLFSHSDIIYGCFSILCMLMFVFQLLTTKKMTHTEAFAIALILYILININITAFFHGSMSKVAFDSLLEFGVKGIPAILMGCIAARKQALHSITNIIDYFIFICALSMAKVLIDFVTVGVIRTQIWNTFGIDYQLISYFASYFFALNLYMICVGYKHLSGSLRKGKLFQTVRFVECIIFVLISLYTGGRGGFVSILVFLLFWGFYYTIKTNHLRLFISFVFLFFGMLILLTNGIVSDSIFSLGFLRIFEFVGESGINWEGTSGRFTIYRSTLELFFSNPFFGVGVTGGSYYGIGSAHNWILEVLIEGGIFYFVFWWIVLYSSYSKFQKRIASNEEYWLLGTFFLTDFIGLMFSFIYLRCTAIWFAIFYVLNDTRDCYIKGK